MPVANFTAPLGMGTDPTAAYLQGQQIGSNNLQQQLTQLQNAKSMAQLPYAGPQAQAQLALTQSQAPLNDAHASYLNQLAENYPGLVGSMIKNNLASAAKARADAGFTTKQIPYAAIPMLGQVGQTIAGAAAASGVIADIQGGQGYGSGVAGIPDSTQGATGQTPNGMQVTVGGSPQPPTAPPGIPGSNLPVTPGQQAKLKGDFPPNATNGNKLQQPAWMNGIPGSQGNQGQSGFTLPGQRNVAATFPGVLYNWQPAVNAAVNPGYSAQQVTLADTDAKNYAADIHNYSKDSNDAQNFLQNLDAFNTHYNKSNLTGPLFGAMPTKGAWSIPSVIANYGSRGGDLSEEALTDMYANTLAIQNAQSLMPGHLTNQTITQTAPNVKPSRMLNPAAEQASVALQRVQALRRMEPTPFFIAAQQQGISNNAAHDLYAAYNQALPVVQNGQAQPQNLGASRDFLQPDMVTALTSNNHISGTAFRNGHRVYQFNNNKNYWVDPWQ